MTRKAPKCDRKLRKKRTKRLRLTHRGIRMRTASDKPRLLTLTSPLMRRLIRQNTMKRIKQMPKGNSDSVSAHLVLGSETGDKNQMMISTTNSEALLTTTAKRLRASQTPSKRPSSAQTKQIHS